MSASPEIFPVKLWNRDEGEIEIKSTLMFLRAGSLFQSCELCIQKA